MERGGFLRTVRGIQPKDWVGDSVGGAEGEFHPRVGGLRRRPKGNFTRGSAGTPSEARGLVPKEWAAARRKPLDMGTFRIAFLRNKTTAGRAPGFFLRIALCTVFILATAPGLGPGSGTASAASADRGPAPPAIAFGLRIGTDVGAPAIHWERPATVPGRPAANSPPTAWFVAFGAERALAGAKVQFGLRQYLSAPDRGFYIGAAATFGFGATRNARWNSAELGLSGGYAWSLGPRWTMTVELGAGTRFMAAQDRYGATATDRAHRAHVGLSLLWRWPP